MRRSLCSERIMHPLPMMPPKQPKACLKKSPSVHEVRFEEHHDRDSLTGTWPDLNAAIIGVLPRQSVA